MDKLVKRHVRALWLPTTVMVLGLVVFGALLRQLSPAGKAIGLVALMACYGWLGRAEFRRLQRMDEMRRRIEMEAMVLASIAGVTLALLLVNAPKLASAPFSAVPLVLVGCYVLVHLRARLRYRYWSL